MVLRDMDDMYVDEWKDYPSPEEGRTTPELYWTSSPESADESGEEDTRIKLELDRVFHEWIDVEQCADCTINTEHA